MRAILMHNEQAGPGHHSAQSLIDEIVGAGHELVELVRDASGLESAIARPCDLVAIAGGDGTVAEAGLVLRGTRLPFAVIPCGTANDIARALGTHGCAWWDRGVARPFDLAIARDDGGAVHVALEAIGLGAFPRTMAEAGDDDADEPLLRDRRHLRARIADAPLARYRITADGVDRSGDYLLVEVMNIDAIGPRVAIAPDARFGDAQLDLVLAGEAERAALLDGLDGLITGAPRRFELPVVRATRMSIACARAAYHVDGQLFGPASSVEIELEAGALRALVPVA